jgi:hypothetical protein
MQNSLSELRAKLVGEWNNQLKSHSVKFPKSENRIIQLLCLYEFYPNPVSQNEMDEWIRYHGGKNNRQARHLAWDGWYIQTGNNKSSRMEVSTTLTSDQLQLVSLVEPNPIWAEFHEEQQRIKQLHPHFQKIVSKFSRRGCAMCGTKALILLPYSELQCEIDEFDTVPLCKECNEWCNSVEVTLQVSDKLVARPLINYRTSIDEDSISITNYEVAGARKAITDCNHMIEVSAVKKKGGPMEGQWSIVIRGPKVTGKSGKKTIYCTPSLSHVKKKLSSFLGDHEIIRPKSGLAGVLPDHDSGE